MTDNKIHDLIIIGAGPAGLTAALYASRRALDTLVITKDIGGQASLTNEIENYPGYEHIEGPVLMNTFHKQAEKHGAVFVYDEVTEVKQGEDKMYTVVTAGGSYSAHAVILAFGLEHRHLGVPGEKEYYAKGVTYCATCDGPLYKKKEICVVGGGNSALDAIDYMAKLATKVHAFIRGDHFKGEEVMVQAVKQHPNVEFHFNSAIKEIKGEQFVKSVILENTKDHSTTEVAVQGVFVEIGYQANVKLYKDLVDMTEQGAVIINDKCETSRAGFFAAGDITTLPYKQVITSGGEGCKAALTAYTYIQKKKGIEVGILGNKK